MDFGMLPPEVNSTRMYTGPGAGPMLAAAAAWDEVAAQLHATAASQSSVVSGLTAGWRGPSSATMAAAAAQYMVWMSTTAGQAELTAAQARAAAGAFETAFAATVPPASVAANRARLLALIATNFFGQNTPAIMATQAEYLEMWAQDAGAMYGYAASSSAAAQLAPFDPPPQTTNPAGASGQAAAVGQATGTATGANTPMALSHLVFATPQTLQGLATPAAAAAPAAADPPSLLSELNMTLTGPLGPTSLYGIVGSPYLLGVENYLVPQNGANLTSAEERLSKIRRAAGKAVPTGEPVSGSRLVGSAGGSGLSAGMGRAQLLGSMSVPPGWTTAAPTVRPVVAVLPGTGMGAVPEALAADAPGSLAGNMALSGLAGRAVAGTGGAAARSVGVAGGAVSGQHAGEVNIFLISDDD
ncbi:PPE family protein [Mycobacterium sp. E2733]|uniref:PPE family protein n=1 Tax=Mycobacterium sp. E2733 TaxID=1834138 RepID=UPI0007FF6B6F|nr:PPE family protein [Mycobacterium sp. E2733]OBI00455.1 ribulose phosphate epimerase [Mycobacterium sp. E2733]